MDIEHKNICDILDHYYPHQLLNATESLDSGYWYTNSGSQVQLSGFLWYIDVTVGTSNVS